MPGIFISYRREDTAGHAGRVFDRLRETFGPDKVFMDVAAIEPGVDFVEAIDRAVGSCDVLLVIIGKHWLSCRDAAGGKRLDDPRDFIRLETATALRRDIRVIPVLVQGATMPGEDDLPDDLKKLARRQATELSDTHWDASFEQLIDTLKKILSETPKPARPGAAEAPHAPARIEEKRELPTPGSSRRSKNRRTWIIAAIAALAVVLAALLFIPGPDKVVVPDLLGMSLDEAVARLKQARLRPGTTRPMPSGRPPGSVIEQDPARGTALSPESAVNLVLAENRAESERPPGAGMVEVPRLVGQPLDKALLLLDNAGLKGSKAVRKETRDGPEGTVIEQAPRPGTLLPRGETVELVIAAVPAGPERVTVPDVTGLDVKRAVTILKEAGLNIEKRPEGVETAAAEPGTVLKQSLRPDSRVPANETIALVYAVAPRSGDTAAEIVLPDFTGSPIPKVEAFLRERGLVIGKVEERPSVDHPAGTVLDQRPSAKTRMEKGAKVDLLVAAAAGERTAILPAPPQTSPIDRHSFDTLPRVAVLRWQPVSGAVSYVVELDCLGCCEPGKRWCSELGRPWQIVRDIPAVASPGHKFEFVGARTGRWRVWGVDKNGREGEKSPWRIFRFTK